MPPQNGIGKGDGPRPCYTPTQLSVSYYFTCDEGRGYVRFVRLFTWPGAPMPGQPLMQSEAEWAVAAPLIVEDVIVDLDRPGVALVTLEDVELGHHVRHAQAVREDAEPITLDREFFMRCINDMCAAGWSLAGDDDVTWQSLETGPTEEISPEQLLEE